jgi:hypothetical protein
MLALNLLVLPEHWSGWLHESIERSVQDLEEQFSVINPGGPDNSKQPVLLRLSGYA